MTTIFSLFSLKYYVVITASFLEHRNQAITSHATLSEMRFPFSYLRFLNAPSLRAHKEHYLEEVGLITSSQQTEPSQINGDQLKAIVNLASKDYKENLPMGLYMGNQLNIANHGLFGLAVASAPSLQEASFIISEYAYLSMPAAEFHITLVKDGVEITWNPTVSLGKQTSLLQESIACVIKNFINSIQQKTKIHKVEFIHENSNSVSFYEKYFACPVIFGAKKNCFLLSPLNPDSAMRESDSQTYRLLQQQLDAQVKTTPSLGTITQKVRAYCYKKLPLISSINKIDVAEKFHMSERTLTRKLSNENQKFNAIIDDITLEYASYCLLNSNSSIQEIASEMGYVSQKSFSRNFKRLSGLAPSDFRKNNKHRSNIL